MELNQVFAQNIQIPQLKKVIPQYEWNEKRFQEEREYFFWWLNKTGFKFADQLRAWQVYEEIHSFDEIDDEEEFTPSWLEEIDNMINQAVRVGNYTEYGGQL